MATTAQAAPQWLVNAELAKSKASAINYITFGPITLKNEVFSELKCESVSAGLLWNESERGFSNTNWQLTSNCKTEPECESIGGSEKALLVPETPANVTEKEGKKTAIRLTTLPWNGELVEPTEKEVRLKSQGISLTLVCPGVLEIPFVEPTAAEEAKGRFPLQPRLENGAKNGLHPSHVVFEGEKTGVLIAKGVPPADEILSYVGENLTLGESKIQLVSIQP
jgi:hypothetical protein